MSRKKANPHVGSSLDDLLAADGTLAQANAIAIKRMPASTPPARGTRFAFPVDLSRDEDGRLFARVPDLPGCLTDSRTRAGALRMAADALEEWLAAQMSDRLDVPQPSPARGRPLVAPGTAMAAKAALYTAMRETRTSNVALAKRIGVAEVEVRRMLDPRHNTKMSRIEQGLAALGRRLIVSVAAA